MTSVYPAPPSVAEISGSGQIGNGEKVVSFTFENCYVGPIFVDTDRDVRAVVDLVQEKVSKTIQTGKMSHSFSNVVALPWEGASFYDS